MITDLASSPVQPVWRRDAFRIKAIWIFKIFVAIVLLRWLWHSGHLDGRALRAVQGGWPLIGLVMSQLAMMVCQMLRWGTLMAVRDLALPARDVLLASLRGQFASVWTPSNLGLDGVRLWQSTRTHPGRSADIVGVLLLDRILGLVALLFWVALAPLWWRQSRLDVLAVFALIALIGIAALIWWARQSLQQRDNMTRIEIVQTAARPSFAARFNMAFDWPAHQRGALIGAVGLSLATHVFNALSFACALAALNDAPQLAKVAAVAPAIILSSVVPLTPLGLGVADAVAQTLFAAVGVPNGANAVMLARATWLLISLVCGAAYFWPHADSSSAAIEQPEIAL